MVSGKRYARSGLVKHYGLLDPKKALEAGKGRRS